MFTIKLDNSRIKAIKIKFMKKVDLMKKIILLSFFCFFLFISCNLASSGDSPNKEIEISQIYWIYENVDYSYWSDGFTDATCFAVFGIKYSGDNISYSDIEYAEYSFDNSKYWSFRLTEENIDSENKRINASDVMHYDGDSPANGNVFYIGSMTFEVKLKNGHVATYDFTVPAPGSTSTDGNRYVYTEDYTGTVYSNYTPMIKRANILSQSKSTNISINFNTSDSLFYSGYVWFYDSSETYIGRTNYFRDYETGAIASFINSGSSLNTDGSNNVLDINSDYIIYNDGKSSTDFNSISQFRIVLTDGIQYSGSSAKYDCRSIGELISF